MRIWIIQTGEPIHIDHGKLRPMRAMNLANYLIEAGHKVTLWTSAFNHADKSNRANEFKKINYNKSLDILLIPSPGYSGNIGIKRLIDHFFLGLNLRKSLLKRSEQLPDIAFIGYPPIETSYVAVNFLKKYNIPTILDVKDLWPTLFLEPFPKILKPIARLIFQPYYYLAKSTIKNTYSICSMSIEYINWVNNFARRKSHNKNIIAPLSTKLQIITNNELENARNWWKSFGIVEKSYSRFYFVGNINSSYDFIPIKKTIEKLNIKKQKFQYIICGQGSEFEKTKHMFNGFDNVIFPGWIDYPKIKRLGKLSNGAILPYKNIENFQLNITNKVIDAISLGSPIISTIDGLLNRFIDENNLGFTCTERSGVDLYEAISLLINNKNLRLKMSQNCLEVYEKLFNADNVYQNLVAEMEKIVIKKKS